VCFFNSSIEVLTKEQIQVYKGNTGSKSATTCLLVNPRELVCVLVPVYCTLSKLAAMVSI